MDDQARFAAQFEITLNRLKRLVAAYDSGLHEEAYALSGLLVKLIGDRYDREGRPKKNAVSLSQRLGRKPTEMLDLSLDPIRHEGLHGPICALGFHVIGAQGMAPVLDGPGPEQFEGKPLPFDDWWSQVVIRDGLGHEHTRRSIVETMRDKEEAHNDDALEPAYGALAYAGGLGIVQRNPSPIFPLDLNPTTVAVRHIAHEVLRTFDPDMAPVFSRLGGARIEPIALIEFSERKPDGDVEVITDRGFWRYQIESTSDPRVIEHWRQESRVTGLPNFKPSSTEPGVELSVRVALLNYNDSAIENVRVQMRLDPGDA